MDISKALLKTFKDMNISSSITSTLFIILLGFFYGERTFLMINLVK